MAGKVFLPHFVVCVFIGIAVSFAAQQIFSFTWSLWSVVGLRAYASRVLKVAVMLVC